MKFGPIAAATALCMSLAACVDGGRREASIAELAAIPRPPGRHCATLAKEVNRYIRMGRSAALADLRARAVKAEASLAGEKAEVSQLCLVLFSDGDCALRGPGFGMLMGVPYHDMKGPAWPIYPMVKTGDTYFALSRGYLLAGQAEPAVDYVNYCAKNGRFRTQPLKVPTRAEALRDLETLRRSPRWQAIRWKHGIKGRGSYFDGNELFVLDHLIGQLPPE